MKIGDIVFLRNNGGRLIGPLEVVGITRITNSGTQIEHRISAATPGSLKRPRQQGDSYFGGFQSQLFIPEDTITNPTKQTKQ